MVGAVEVSFVSPLLAGRRRITCQDVPGVGPLLSLPVYPPQKTASLGELVKSFLSVRDQTSKRFAL